MADASFHVDHGERDARPVSPGEAAVSNGEALACLKGVGKAFGNGVVALAGVNLDIRRGEFVSLLGPSGCGKSTVLRLISGLTTPTEGAIEWGQGDHTLGFVFQEPTLMPWATVFDNVWLPLRLTGASRATARERIDEMLAKVGLTGFAKSYPRELSGGMKMRVSVARALVTRPSLLLMDEPFAALDEITRTKLNDDLITLKCELGSTVVFVTHSVFESVYLSDRIVVMAPRPGRIASEVVVPTPLPRDEDFRLGATYAEKCRETSLALHRAMDAGLNK